MWRKSRCSNIFKNNSKILSNLSPKLKRKLLLFNKYNEDKSNLSLLYKGMKIDFILKVFGDFQNQVYNSDIIFARCGASTLAEIGIVKKCTHFRFTFVR